MKIKNIKYIACAMVLGFGLTSCEDFLDRPAEDSYNADNYYSSDDACVAGVNYLYNSPWYDFERGFIKMGEVMSGNMYWGSSPYLNFSVNGTDEDLINMSYSLWAEIAHCNTVYQSLGNATGSSADVVNQCKGECLVWKAMAYFYLVRSFGDVPIIHNTSEALAKEEYKTCYKVEKADVYEYICKTLKYAMTLMKQEKRDDGHIDYYGAEGLLAKVYLTKAGVTGTLDPDDLANAVFYAKDVFKNSGRTLMANYEDIFRGSNNISDESLIAWRPTASGAHWTCQNSFQSDLAPEGFDEYGDCWGGWGGPSLDLMLAFDADPTVSPDKRIDLDARRKATCMMPGDYYSYFWRDHTILKGTYAGKKGFDILSFYFDTDYNSAATGEFQGPCGAQNVKNLYGDRADHVAEMGETPARMASGLATHILRLSDVYLVLAEAQALYDGGSTSEDTALICYNQVRGRAVSNYVAKDSKKGDKLTFDEVWKERRLEFAGEGDRWYDFVRLSYYNLDACIAEIQAQRRSAVWNLSDVYKDYFKSGTWDISNVSYETAYDHPTVTKATFTIPFPTEDVALNANLGSNVAPIHVDMTTNYNY